jgi:hypothetical protein
MDIEIAKALRTGLEAQGIEAHLESYQDVEGGSVVTRWRVAAKLTNHAAGSTCVRTLMEPADAEQVAKEMRADLASRAKRTRRAIRAERRYS